MSKLIARGLALVAIGWSLAGCQSTGDKEVAQMDPPPQFAPTTFVRPLHRLEGRYPNLFSPDSFVVWVDDDVAALKREKDGEDNVVIEAPIEEAAEAINRDFIVLECHVGSMFSDTSIAYDVVGFRGIDVFLRTADGRRIDPIQTIIGGVEEEQREALKMYRRINLVVFPRTDVWRGGELVAADAPKLTLVLDGHSSSFFADWVGAPQGEGRKGWRPSESERYQVVKLGFRDVYGRLLRLIHVFD